MPDEQVLIQRAADGDAEAFSQLVRQYQQRIFAFIMRMTANREAALDLTQDSFLAAYQNLSGFRRESSFSTWLFQIAVNKSKNYLKKAGRELPLPDNYDHTDPAPRPDDSYEAKQNRIRLQAEIKNLPEKQRAVFTLRFFEQLKFGEIAEIQKVSVSSVKTSFAEALKKLKARLS